MLFLINAMEDISITEKKGLDENLKKNPLRIYFIHSVSKRATPFALILKQGIKDLLDPPSNP